MEPLETMVSVLSGRLEGEVVEGERGKPFLARATVGTSLYVLLRQSVSQLVSQLVS